MTDYTYTSAPQDGPALALIVLQADETIEGDFRRMFGRDVPLHVSRVPSGAEVSPETLQAMAAHLAAAAALLPRGIRYGAVGYGCTSASAQIGVAEVAQQVRAGVETAHVSNPLSAVAAACSALGARRLAVLSPYVSQVSDSLRDALKRAGIATPLLGSFNEAEEAKVVRISGASLRAAARDLVSRGAVDALFLSCTNLRTLDVIETLESDLGLPVLASNPCLAWHMARLAGVPVSGGPGRLFQTQT